MPDTAHGAFRAGLTIALIVVFLDQLTKLAAEHWLMAYQPVAVVPMLNLTLSYNTGAAFSLLADQPGWQRWLFSGLAVAVTGYILHWLWSLGPRFGWQALGLALIAGGAVGNLVDRIAYGHVVDFIDVYYGEWHWPAFNVADSAISVGVAILIIHALFAGEGRR